MILPVQIHTFPMILLVQIYTFPTKYASENYTFPIIEAKKSQTNPMEWLWVVGCRSVLSSRHIQPKKQGDESAQLDGASVRECLPALAVGIVCVGDDDKG